MLSPSFPRYVRKERPARLTNRPSFRTMERARKVRTLEVQYTWNSEVITVSGYSLQLQYVELRSYGSQAQYTSDALRMEVKALTNCRVAEKRGEGLSCHRINLTAMLDGTTSTWGLSSRFLSLILSRWAPRDRRIRKLQGSGLSQLLTL